MALPKQVEAALAAADATLAAANAPATEAVTTEDIAPAAPVSPDPFEQASSQQVAAPEQPPAPAEKPDVWSHKYDVLRGKYDAEVPRLHQQVRELETNLRTAIERLNEASKAKESAPVQKPVADAKDVENFGGDLVDMVGRIASGHMAQVARQVDEKVSALEQAIAKLQQHLTGTAQQVAMTAEQTFFDRVGKLVPDWETINANQGFLAWLAEVDPVYGVPRQQALKVAQDQLNPDRAAAVFLAWPGRKPAPAAGPDPLDKQVSPKGAATVAPQANDKPMLTQGQITKFYDDLRRGMYRGRDAEAAQIEQVINTALAEGRVR